MKPNRRDVASLSAPSVERPHLQLHDSEVVSFWEAAVVERVAGAAVALVQILIHPQTKVPTAEGREDVGKKIKLSLYFLQFGLTEYPL